MWEFYYEDGSWIVRKTGGKGYSDLLFHVQSKANAIELSAALNDYENSNTTKKGWLQ